MDRWEDYYGLLQVHPQAEQEIIQGAYKRLCRKYHPDVNPTASASQLMTRINEAYEVLSSPTARRQYHAEWQRRNNTPGQASAPRVEVRERVVYVNREQPHGGTEAAAKIVGQYFQYLSKRDYKNAYSTISTADKDCFGYGAYVEWQESVSQLYEVGSTKLKLFKRYEAMKINDSGLKLPCEEYTVTINEKNKSTGAVSEYNLTKYAVLEQGGWRVYLGYRDLTPLMIQFKVMASNLKEVQLLSLWERHKQQNDLEMGLPNRAGFEQAASREIYRHKRYARPFTIAVFSVAMPPHIAVEQELHSRILKYAGYVISQTIREVDSMAWLGDNYFGAVLAETSKQNATSAVRRILKTVRHDVAACFDFELVISAGVVEYNGDTVDNLLENCKRTIRAAAESPGKRVNKQTAE